MCLEALVPQVSGDRQLHVVVVDNASGDDSPDRIERTVTERGWCQWVDIVRCSRNAGFSAGNNVGIRHARADAYLLINSDAFVQEGAIGSLLTALDVHAGAGLISPRLRLPDGSLHHSCYRFWSPMSELLRAARTGPLARLLERYTYLLPHEDVPSGPDWTSFACVLVRREVIDEIGLMDEGYFMYFEDQDYCRRARMAGWEVLNWPEAVVVHAQGGSGPVRSLLKQRKRPPRYYYASRSRYFAKFYGTAGLWLSNLMWIVGRSISWPREFVGHKQVHLCRCEFCDNWTNAWRPLKATHLVVDP